MVTFSFSKYFPPFLLRLLFVCSSCYCDVFLLQKLLLALLRFSSLQKEYNFLLPIFNCRTFFCRPEMGTIVKSSSSSILGLNKSKLRGKIPSCYVLLFGRLCFNIWTSGLVPRCLYICGHIAFRHGASAFQLSHQARSVRTSSVRTSFSSVRTSQFSSDLQGVNYS